jgi:hypothetical protein
MATVALMSVKVKQLWIWPWTAPRIPAAARPPAADDPLTRICPEHRVICLLDDTVTRGGVWCPTGPHRLARWLIRERGTGKIVGMGGEGNADDEDGISVICD